MVCGGSLTFAEKMEERKWITTEQMLENLKNEPDVEQEYRHHLGGILRSTHWLEYSSQRHEIGDSTDWKDSSWHSEDEFLEMHRGEWWMKE